MTEKGPLFMSTLHINFTSPPVFGIRVLPRARGRSDKARYFSRALLRARGDDDTSRRTRTNARPFMPPPPDSIQWLPEGGVSFFLSALNYFDRLRDEPHYNNNNNILCKL